MEGFTFVEKSAYVCVRFTLVGGFTFGGVTTHNCKSLCSTCNPIGYVSFGQDSGSSLSAN